MHTDPLLVTLGITRENGASAATILNILSCLCADNECFICKTSALMRGVGLVEVTQNLKYSLKKKAPSKLAHYYCVFFFSVSLFSKLIKLQTKMALRGEFFYLSKGVE